MSEDIKKEEQFVVEELKYKSKETENSANDAKYTVKEDANKVIVTGIADFNLEHTFECGQCFRWEKEDDGSYTGVAYGKVVNVSMPSDDQIIINNCSITDYYDIWRDFFDLDRDYTQIKRVLSKDPVLKRAIEYGWGIRLLNQEFHETVFSFIISQNNNIPRIRKIISELSKGLGMPITYNKKTYYSFPELHMLSPNGRDKIDACRAGYRCKYILDSASYLSQNVLSVEGLRSADFIEARNQIMQLNGVGEKVADCILLFSGIKSDSFPVDRWVIRVINKFYGDDFKSEPSKADIRRFATERFGEYAGIAQQYLFYYALKNMK